MSDILSLLQDFDVANFLPAPDKFLTGLTGWIRVILLAGPLLLLGIGLWDRYVSPKQHGSRLCFPMWVNVTGKKAWAYAQRLCNVTCLLLGGGLSVLMLIISLFFSGERGLAMIYVALVCMIIEFILVLIAWIGINILVGKAYGKNGNLRK